MPPQTSNGWGEYSRLVLTKLTEHQKLLQSISGELTNIRVEIAMLKVKSGAWGLLAGALPVIGLIVYKAVAGG